MPDEGSRGGANLESRGFSASYLQALPAFLVLSTETQEIKPCILAAHGDKQMLQRQGLSLSQLGPQSLRDPFPLSLCCSVNNCH